MVYSLLFTYLLKPINEYNDIISTYVNEIKRDDIFPSFYLPIQYNLSMNIMI